MITGIFCICLSIWPAVGRISIQLHLTYEIRFIEVILYVAIFETGTVYSNNSEDF